MAKPRPILGGVREAARQALEVAGRRRRLESDHVGPEDALEDGAAPREAREQLLGGKRNVEKVPDAQVGTKPPEQ
jgi:hypothetical protein